MRLAPQAHKADQPGLRGHSHNPAEDLMKRFLVSRHTPSGWLALASYDTAGPAWVKAYQIAYVGPDPSVPHPAVRIENQFTGEVLWG